MAVTQDSEQVKSDLETIAPRRLSLVLPAGPTLVRVEPRITDFESGQDPTRASRDLARSSRLQRRVRPIHELHERGRKQELLGSGPSSARRTHRYRRVHYRGKQRRHRYIVGDQTRDRRDSTRPFRIDEPGDPRRAWDRVRNGPKICSIGPRRLFGLLGRTTPNPWSDCSRGYRTPALLRCTPARELLV